MPVTSTAGFHEELVNADVSELECPAYDGDGLIALKGKSPSQVSFAASTRKIKLEEWQLDLPQNVYIALCGLADATWWLSNKNMDSYSIKWPKSWIKGADRQAELDEVPPLPVKSSRELVAAQLAETNQKPKLVAAGNIEEFDKFARKACQSPELAYLAMMALLYRQTQDKLVLSKFTEARQKIGAHLLAIDTIVGPT